MVDVRVASTDSGGRFGPDSDVNAPGLLSFDDLVGARDGSMLLVWHEYGDFPLAGAGLGESAAYRFVAALRPAGSTSFQAPEDVSPLQGWSSLNDVTAADAGFDPATGRPTIIWPAAEFGGTPPVRIPGTATVKLATRTG
jgi:hypothetical protein